MSIFNKTELEKLIKSDKWIPYDDLSSEFKEFLESSQFSKYKLK